MSEGRKDLELDPLKELARLRDDWNDEIPEQVVHSNSPMANFKVRRGWFGNIILATRLALDDKSIRSDEGKKAAEQLISRFTSDKFREQKLTKKEDIQEANRLIDIVLKREPAT